MKKRNLITLLSLILVVFMWSCSNEENLDNNEYLLTIEEAILLSKVIEYTESNSRSDGYQITTQDVIQDENSVNSILILNQIIGGNDFFSIISLDTRTLPVLAFGHGVFSIPDVSPETNFWLDGQLKLIEEVRRNNITLKQFVSNVNGENDGVTGPDPCVSGVSWNGPIVDHTWGQGCVYNEDCPNMSCDIGSCSSPQAYTGCVATSIVQVLGYHEEPASVPWSTMLNRYNSWDFGASGADELSDVMAVAGIAVNMDYGCDGSGVPSNLFESALEDAFEDTFQYSSSGTYHENTNVSSWNDYIGVSGSIGHERPVILAGFRTDINGNTFGHAWVCDGTRMEYKCNEPTTYFYYMNWGWNGTANAWYVGYGRYPNNTIRVTHIKP